MPAGEIANTRERIPNPDPTSLTTAQLDKAIDAQIIRCLAVLCAAMTLGGCALAPQHVTVGTGTANNALTGNVVGMTGFVSATYDFK